MNFGFAMREKKDEETYFSVHKDDISSFADQKSYRVTPCIGVGVEDYFIVERLGKYVPEDRQSTTFS